jgi:mRNA interferase MazF
VLPSRGDVFAALLDPTRGSEQAGRRPVIIVSRDAINHSSSVVIVVPVTDLANCARIYPSQVVLRKGAGGLSIDSVALCEQVRAITKNRLGGHMGRLDSKSVAIIGEKLKIALDLD